MTVLYHPPSSARRKAVLPLSILSLAAVLGEEYAIVDGNLEHDPVGRLSALIEAHRARVVGITVMPGPQLANAVPVSRALKQRFPGLLIVWGGYFPSQHAEVCLRDGCVDAVVRGHGELTFRDLVARHLRDEDWRALPGVASRCPQTGELQDNGLSVMPHPDCLPDYPYEAIDLSRYVRATFMGARTLSHHSSYGCPFSCNFCAVVNLAHGRWLAQSAERTAATVERLVREQGATAVEFFDNNFFVDERRVAAFARRIERLRIGWWGEGRIDTMLRFEDHTWRAMRASGLRMVYLGAESGSETTLASMDKGGTLTPAMTLQIAETCARYDVVPEFSFVVGNPPDPAADVEATIGLVRNIKRVNRRAEIVFYLYTPVPLAGDLYEGVRTRGFAFPSTLDEWIAPRWLDFAQRRSHRLSWVSGAVRRRVRDFERVLHARFPTVTDPALVGLRRSIPRVLSGWRYRLGVYGHPLELRVLQRLWPYQRPETAGF